jgi:hypothetical protein
MKGYQKRFENGEDAALLHALDVWLDCFKGPPAWIANGFFDAISKFHVGATLDEAFGVKRVSGKHVDQWRRREALRVPVMFEIAYLVQRGAPIDARTFARVGELVGRSPSDIARIYYEPASAAWRKLLRNWLISDKSEVG